MQCGSSVGSGPLPKGCWLHCVGISLLWGMHMPLQGKLRYLAWRWVWPCSRLNPKFIYLWCAPGGAHKPHGCEGMLELHSYSYASASLAPLTMRSLLCIHFCTMRSHSVPARHYGFLCIKFIKPWMIHGKASGVRPCTHPSHENMQMALMHVPGSPAALTA